MTAVITKCLGLRQLPIGVASVMLGTGCAAFTGNIEPLSAMICLLFVISMQITVNVAYRYYDEKHGYGSNIDDGLGTEVRGMPMISMLREMFLSIALISAMLGLTLAAMGGWLIILVDVAVIAGVYFSAAAAAPASRSPYGIFFQFIFYGPMAVLTTCYIQTRHESISSIWSWELMGCAVWLSIALGLMTVNTFLCEEFGSYSPDKSNGKRTFVAAYGRHKTRRLFLVNAIGSFLATCLFGLDFLQLNRAWLLVIPAICVAWYFFIWLRLKPESGKGFRGITEECLANELLYAISFLIIAIAIAPQGTTPRVLISNWLL